MASKPDQSTKPDEAGQAEGYKEQLDRLAMEKKRNGQQEQHSSTSTLVEKITEYIPAASKILGGSAQAKEQPQETAPSDATTPPYRPDHDDKIEEFVRDQHRSGKETGAPVAQ